MEQNSPGRRIAFHNLGCKVNSYETEAMLRQMLAAGYTSVPFAPGADIYVVKPFNMRRLVMQCNNLINTRRLLQNKYAHQLDSKAEKIATNELDQRFIEQATQVVEDNMENPEFSVDVFSREMGVGRTVLFQKIKGITGSTPNNFIMNLRLKKAAYFLQNSPEMNISDIAYRLGFGNPQYFNKCFKELFDIAPTQYRKAHNTSSEPSVK